MNSKSAENWVVAELKHHVLHNLTYGIMYDIRIGSSL